MEIIKNLLVNKTMILVVCVVMLLDILTGTIKAFIDRNFQSTKFREGLFKKLYELVFIICGYILDYVIGSDYVGMAMIYLVIGMELYSIMIENASEYIPLPDNVKAIIEQLRGGSNETK